MVRYLFYTIGDLTYQSPLVECFCSTKPFVAVQCGRETENLYEKVRSVRDTLACAAIGVCFPCILPTVL